MSSITTNNHLTDIINNKHVVVTSQHLDTLSVSWLDVEKKKITDDTAKIPALNLLNDVKLSVESNINEITNINVSCNTLQENDIYLSSAIDEHQAAIDGHDVAIHNLDGLKDLIDCKVVRFKGVSSTDPSSGIVTVNGIQHIVSCDFTEENNGDIYYYHKQVDKLGKKVEVLFAYVYSNGLFNHHTVDQLNGQFYKIGYGFYDNLSTLIFDDMVDVSAAIKRYKIDGLVDILDTTSADIEFLSARLSSDEISVADDISYLSSCIDGISAEVENNYATKEELHNTEDRIDDDITKCVKYADIQKNVGSHTEYDSYNYLDDNPNKVPSTKLLKAIFSNYNKHKHVSADVTDLKAGLGYWKTNTLDTEYDRVYVNSGITGSNAHLTATNDVAAVDGNKTNLLIPTLNVVKQLLDKLEKITEPPIGTLRFVASSTALLANRNKSITTDTFDGWVYPNGEKLAVNTKEFERAKRELMGDNKVAADYIQLPNLCNFIKLNPQQNTTVKPIDSSDWNSVDFHNGLVKHTHDVSNLKLVSSSEKPTISATGTAPGSNGVGPGGMAHNGTGTRTDDINLAININMGDMSNTLKIGGTISEAGDNTETYPKHNIIPVLMYIGHKDDK